MVERISKRINNSKNILFCGVRWRPRCHGCVDDFGTCNVSRIIYCGCKAGDRIRSYVYVCDLGFLAITSYAHLLGVQWYHLHLPPHQILLYSM